MLLPWTMSFEDEQLQLASRQIETWCCSQQAWHFGQALANNVLLKHAAHHLSISDVGAVASVLAVASATFAAVPGAQIVPFDAVPPELSLIYSALYAVPLLGLCLAALPELCAAAAAAAALGLFVVALQTELYATADHDTTVAFVEIELESSAVDE